MSASTLIQGLQVTIVSNTVVGNTTISVPAGFAIAGLFVQETANHAVTGGLDIGTTNGGVDIASAMAVGALANVYLTDVTLLKRLFSMSAAQTVYINAHTGWNSASINLQVPLLKLY